jgi:hypothetical protein
MDYLKIINNTIQYVTGAGHMHYRWTILLARSKAVLSHTVPRDYIKLKTTTIQVIKS